MQSVDQKNTHLLHRVFTISRKYRQIILASALAIWCVVPILGIVFLLLYCQINLSSNLDAQKKKPFLNFVPILLVIFTIVTYIATFKSFNDTDTYIGVYELLGRESPFSFPAMDMEPGAFILPKYISLMTGGNSRIFLLFQSLTMNVAFTVYAILFVPEFYPIVVLINVMSQGYYFQLFWMRQIYSLIFIIPAIYTNIFMWRWFLVTLGFFTHSASVIYGFTFVLTSVKDFLSSSIRRVRSNLKIRNGIDRPKLVMLILSLLIIIVFGPLFQFILQSAGLLSILTGDVVTDKVSTYTTDDSNMAIFSLASQLRTILDYATIFVFALAADYSKPNPLLTRWTILFVTVFGLYIGSYISGFNLRIASIFFCMPGFFYTIPLLSGKFDSELGKNSRSNIYVYILCGSIVIRILYFFNNLISSYETENYLTFWGGQTLTTPITGYFEFIFKCFSGT
jgi:EpsG family